MNILRSRFFQAVVVLVLAFVLLRFGIRPPATWRDQTLNIFKVILAVVI
jgi:hypothetical protein